VVILSLDTALMIDIIRRRSSSSTRNSLHQAVRFGAKPVVSAVVLHELVVGSWLNPNPVIERARIDEALLGIDVIELTGDDAEVTGRIGGLLRRNGRPIGDIDTLIAGQALARGWTVVTGNVRHFGRIEGLVLIDWSVGPDPLSSDEIAERVARAN
jgi:tRNA(fMet)-specific endonuclease VapC